MSKKKAYVSFEPEYFEPGTLVVLDPNLFNMLPPGSLGLIMERSPERVGDPVFGPQHLHTVLANGRMYKAARSALLRESEEK